MNQIVGIVMLLGLTACAHEKPVIAPKKLRVSKEAKIYRCMLKLLDRDVGALDAQLACNRTFRRCKK